MKALVASVHRLLLVDLATHETTILEDHRPEYYGISWTTDGRQLCLSHSGLDNNTIHSLEDYVDSERGWLSLGDHNSPPAMIPWEPRFLETQGLQTLSREECLANDAADSKPMQRRGTAREAPIGWR